MKGQYVVAEVRGRMYRFEERTIKEECDCPKCGTVVAVTFRTARWEKSPRGRIVRHDDFDSGLGYCPTCDQVREGFLPEREQMFAM